MRNILFIASILFGLAAIGNLFDGNIGLGLLLAFCAWGCYEESRPPPPPPPPTYERVGRQTIDVYRRKS